MTSPHSVAPLTIANSTVAAVMTISPITVKAYQTVKEATILMLDHRVTALPVVDENGKAVGVISQTDIVRYEREKVDYGYKKPAFYDDANLELPSGEVLFKGFELEKADLTKVAEIMTPMVLAIKPEDSLTKVVQEMLTHHVHRLFVENEHQSLVGVISTFDILRQIKT